MQSVIPFDLRYVNYSYYSLLITLGTVKDILSNISLSESDVYYVPSTSLGGGGWLYLYSFTCLSTEVVE